MNLVNCRRVQKFRSDYNDLRKSFEQTKQITENLVGGLAHLPPSIELPPFLTLLPSMPRVSVLLCSTPHRLLCHLPLLDNDFSLVHQRQFQNRHSTSRLNPLLGSNMPSTSILFSKRRRHAWMTSLPMGWRFGITSRIRKRC